MVRTLIIFALLMPGVAFAYLYNDTDVIETSTGEPRLIPEHVWGQGSAVTPGGYIVIPATPDTSPQGEDADEPDSLPEDAADAPGPAVNPTLDPSQNSDSGYLPGDPSGGPVDSDEEVFKLLLQEGALSGESLTAIGEETTQGSFFRSAFSNEAITSLWGVTVSGSRVREILSGKYDLQDILSFWRNRKTGNLNLRGLGLVGASKAAADNNIESIRFRADAFQITYRSRGYLFAVFPKSFPVTITVVPESTEERVHVKLPWYRFFVRKFFTVRSLTAEVDAVITEGIKKNTGNDNDIRAVLLDAVADFLKKEVGTISDSIYLGR